MLKRLDGASAYEPSRRSEAWIKASSECVCVCVRERESRMACNRLHGLHSCVCVYVCVCRMPNNRLHGLYAFVYVSAAVLS